MRHCGLFDPIPHVIVGINQTRNRNPYRSLGLVAVHGKAGVLHHQPTGMWSAACRLTTNIIERRHRPYPTQVNGGAAAATGNSFTIHHPQSRGSVLSKIVSEKSLFEHTCCKLAGKGIPTSMFSV